MYTYMYICICICICMKWERADVHGCIYAWIYVCIDVRMYKSIHVYIPIWARIHVCNVYMYIPMHVLGHECIYMYLYIYMYTCTCTYIHTRTLHEYQQRTYWCLCVSCVCMCIPMHCARMCVCVHVCMLHANMVFIPTITRPAKDSNIKTTGKTTNKTTSKTNKTHIQSNQTTIQCLFKTPVSNADFPQWKKTFGAPHIEEQNQHWHTTTYIIFPYSKKGPELCRSLYISRSSTCNSEPYPPSQPCDACPFSCSHTPSAGQTAVDQESWSMLR